MYRILLEGPQQPISLDSSTEVPNSPPNSIQLSAPPSPFENNCAPSQAPTLVSGCLDYLSYGQSQELRRRHGNLRKDTREVFQTQLASIRGQNASITQEMQGNSEVPVTGTGRGGRPPGDVEDHSQRPTFELDKRY